MFIYILIRFFRNLIKIQSNNIDIQNLNLFRYQIQLLSQSPNFYMRKLNLLKSFSTFYPKNMDISAPDTFYFKDIQKNLIKDNSKVPNFDPSKMQFGKDTTEHMFVAEWENGKWKNPVIKPFEELKLHPFNSTLHYGIQCYEGLKAYKTSNGQLRLFRPQCNMKRFKLSSKRISLPDFDGNELLKCLQQYVRVQKKWVPPIHAHSLYLRPFHISNENTLGVKTPNKSLLLIVASPVGAYYQSGFNPVSILCDPKYIRSATGGTGNYKVGGNYGPTIAITEESKKKGHEQNLYLFDGKIGEIGTSNIFFVFKEGQKIKLVTPQLEDLVLPGVTRDTIIELIRSKGITVEQRVIKIDELVGRAQKGELVECFTSGTAVIVSPVKNIEYNGKNYPVHVDPKLKAGKLTYEIFETILGIQQGTIEDKFGWTRIISN